MTVKIVVYSKEYNEELYSSEINTRIKNLTNKYVLELQKLTVEAQVTISITSKDASEAKQEEMEFLVEVKNQFDENIIWDTIIEVSNNI